MVDLNKMEERMMLSFIKRITPSSIDEIYNSRFNRFIFDQSSEIEIDGKTLNERYSELFPNSSNSLKRIKVSSLIKSGYLPHNG